MKKSSKKLPKWVKGIVAVLFILTLGVGFIDKAANNLQITATEAISSTTMAELIKRSDRITIEHNLANGFEESAIAVGEENIDIEKDKAEDGLQNSFSMEKIQTLDGLVTFFNSGMPESNGLIELVTGTIDITREEMNDKANLSVCQYLEDFTYPANTAWVDGKTVDSNQRDGHPGDLVFWVVSPRSEEAFAIRGACANGQKEEPKPLDDTTTTSATTDNDTTSTTGTTGTTKGHGYGAGDGTEIDAGQGTMATDPPRTDPGKDNIEEEPTVQTTQTAWNGFLEWWGNSGGSSSGVIAESKSTDVRITVTEDEYLQSQYNTTGATTAGSTSAGQTTTKPPPTTKYVHTGTNDGGF